MADPELLKSLPSVDEVLKSPEGSRWLAAHPRRYVLEAVRGAIEDCRSRILTGEPPQETTAPVDVAALAPAVEGALRRLTAYSLRRVINATGIVVHTNLGRSPLGHSVLRHVTEVAAGYSTLEYDLAAGTRGKRYTHVRRLIREVTGAEDGIAVNNNAAAVLLVLGELARGREVIVSRGELVEIGGSFRVPDVMAQSGALLREAGTTNKTHLRDYEAAITEQTGLILKVHQSNYRIRGFTSDVPLEALAALGRSRGIPVMYDLGSGSVLDMARHGVTGEPTVEQMVRTGADVLTFSGDKLLGGPQAGIIAGRRDIIAGLQKNPLLRALRIDKLTLAALEATLMLYADPDKARVDIPTLRMLLEPADTVRKRARRAAALIRKHAPAGAEVSVVRDVAYTGGGALPEQGVESYAVALHSDSLSSNALEERLRQGGDPPVIARIKEDTLLLDVRTVADGEIKDLAARAADALTPAGPAA